MVPGCKIRSLTRTSQYYIKFYDIFIDWPLRKPVSNIHYECNSLLNGYVIVEKNACTLNRS